MVQVKPHTAGHPGQADHGVNGETFLKFRVLLHRAPVSKAENPV